MLLGASQAAVPSGTLKIGAGGASRAQQKPFAAMPNPKNRKMSRRLHTQTMNHQYPLRFVTDLEARGALQSPTEAICCDV